MSMIGNDVKRTYQIDSASTMYGPAPGLGPISGCYQKDADTDWFIDLTDSELLALLRCEDNHRVDHEWIVNMSGDGDGALRIYDDYVE